MEPTNFDNIDHIIKTFDIKKQYLLFPAPLPQSGIEIDQYLAVSILKTNLDIRNAWEIGKNDLDRIAIRENDTPIIPDDVINAPVLELLKRKLK